MAPGWSFPTESRYQKDLREQLKLGCRALALLAAVLFPLFSGLDAYTQSEHFAELSWTRFGTAAIYAVLYLAIRRGRLLGNPALTAVALLLIAAASITAMCLITGGYPSPYYAGINLVILAAVVVLPWGPRPMAFSVLGIVSVYLLAALAHAEFRIEQPAVLANSVYFLLATGVIGVTSAWLTDRLRRQSFRRLLEVEGAHSAVELREEFISIASHELKTPLTALKLQVQIARRQLARPGGADDPLALGRLHDAYEAQIRRIERLIEDMLDVSRLKEGKFELQSASLDLRVIVGDIARTIQPRFVASEIPFAVHADEALPVRVDPLRIEQVVMNLLTNALRYGAGKPVELHLFRDGDCAVLEVRDRGIGIPAEKREQIFERFERAAPSSKFGGLGLGLYITRKIVEAHGGSVSVKSRAGEGSTFCVILPMEQAKMAANH